LGRGWVQCEHTFYSQFIGLGVGAVHRVGGGHNS